MNPLGFLVLETGEVFAGQWEGGSARAGEVVFNTSHSGYEEMATDLSYYSQILVMTAPMQGNYGESEKAWESDQFSIHGFVCLEMQNSKRDRSWLSQLDQQGVPVLSGVDTRRLVLRLREGGTTWGAIVNASSESDARQMAQPLMKEAQKKDLDWAYQVATKTQQIIPGDCSSGPRVAVLDFGSKKNILRELQSRCSEIGIFPPRSSAEEVLSWRPDGVMLTNGPGDPADVLVAPETVRDLLGKVYVFGICMGHQILARALGAQTYKLKFGHRGSNHPIRDELLNKVYMTSQNHGYAVDKDSLPKDVKVTHINLNDGTVSGIYSEKHKCFSVQFHPESHPGPHDAEGLFDYFIKQIQ